MEIKEIKFLLKKVDEFDAIKVFLFTKNCVRKRKRESKSNKKEVSSS